MTGQLALPRSGDLAKAVILPIGYAVGLLVSGPLEGGRAHLRSHAGGCAVAAR